jgi:hypothetical protein
LATALLVVACGTPAKVVSTTSTPEPSGAASSNTALDDLAAARSRWAGAGLDSYRFEFEDDCAECDPSLRIPRDVVVWGGEPTALQHPTVEVLFDTVESAISEGQSVEVTYHPELGHPTEIAIDMEARAYDGGTHWIARDLRPGLPGSSVSLATLEDARQLWEAIGPSAYEFRTAIGCDCPWSGTIWTQVDGRRIVDWRIEFADGKGEQISPITIDDMFEDLTEMLSSSDGVLEGGIRFTGSAAYDPEFGYPVWIGLDIEILDPDSELAGLPPRLVFSVQDFRLIEPPEPGSGSSDLEAAQRRWVEADLTNYDYHLTIHDIKTATFSEPYIISVREGVVVAVEHQGLLVDDAEGPIVTIEALFDLVEGWIADGATVEGLYHERLGHPVLLVVRGSDQVEETPLTISIDNLTPTPGDEQ